MVSRGFPLFTLFVLPVIYTFFAADHRPLVMDDDEPLATSQLV